jgi:hypothetical protein
MPKERRQSYNRPVEIWFGGDKLVDANVRLSGYFDGMAAVGTEDDPVEGPSSWEAMLDIPSSLDLRALVGEEIEMRFRDGGVGQAVLIDTSGRLEGFGDVPFD